MNTMEQGKHDTGLDVQVNLPTSGNPIADTMARIVEGPYQETYDLGERVMVNGKKTHIEVPPQSDWFEIRNIRGREQIYLKFQCTGLETIYYGPHDTKEEALLTLDKILTGSMDALLNA